MPEDIWQSLTKTALRLMGNRSGHRVDIDAVTTATLAAHSELPNVEQHRERLRAFVRDMLDGQTTRR